MVRSRSVVSILSGLAVFAILCRAETAFAQPSGQDVATAQALFDEGKRLMQAGKLDEACPKLVESQRLDPAGGTLLVIALCHEAQGKTATAWAEFGVALGEARKDRRADREKAALEHIKALEPKLTRLRLVVGSQRIDQLEVRRDGARLGEAQWGTPLPIDPGDHVFEARAPGKQTWSKTIPVKGEGATVDVTIPALEDEVAAAPVAKVAPVAPVVAPAVVTTVPPVPTPPPPDSDASGARTTRLTLAAIVGGVGLVATGVGVAFGASASAKWSDAETACPNGHCRAEAARKIGEDAGTSADLSTLLFIIGGVGLGTGVVLWLTAPGVGGANSATGASTSKHGLHLTPLMTRESGGLMLGGTL